MAKPDLRELRPNPKARKPAPGPEEVRGASLTVIKAFVWFSLGLGVGLYLVP